MQTGTERASQPASLIRTAAAAASGLVSILIHCVERSFACYFIMFLGRFIIMKAFGQQSKTQLLVFFRLQPANQRKMDAFGRSAGHLRWHTSGMPHESIPFVLECL